MPQISSLLGGGGGAMQAAPSMAQMPMSKPPMMDRMGNSSWWRSMLDSEALKSGLETVGQFGQQSGQQTAEEARPAPQQLMQPPPPSMSPEVMQLVRQMMQQAGGSGMPSQMRGAPGLYRGR